MYWQTIGKSIVCQYKSGTSIEGIRFAIDALDIRAAGRSVQCIERPAAVFLEKNDRCLLCLV